MEPAVIQLTSDDINFQIKSKLLLRDVIIRGGFSLKPGCDLESCTYCPAVHLNLETNKMNDDRNQEISDYADQSLCGVYQNSALFRLSPNSVLNLTNVNFVNIRHQPKALILNQCGHLNMSNVIFSNVMADRLGLNGGVIQQIPMTEYEPYYCGSFYYNTGLVELLNNGYEHSDDSYFSGFLWLTALHSIIITNVTFQYNYILIGKTQQVYGSSMMYLLQFRELQLTNCSFLYNLADTGAAVYVYSSLNIPIVVANGISVEHTLTHILIEGNCFVNNTGRVGSVLYIRFLRDHQNIILRNNTFVNNFATESGIIDLDFAYLSDKYTVGQNTSIVAGGVKVNVFIPPIIIIFSELRFVSIYSPIICSISNVANFIMTDVYFYDSGDSLSGLDYLKLILSAYIANPQSYTILTPPDEPSLSCLESVLVQNSYNVTITQTIFEYNNCLSPGPSISGDTQFVRDIQINFSSLTFRNNRGFGMLAIMTSLDLVLDRLTFINNSNTENEYSVCLEITQVEPSVITISNSEFKGNRAVYSTLARISGAIGVILSSIVATDNIASSTSAGLMFTPLVSMNSFVTVVNSIFRYNTSLRSGVVLITETSGNMLFTSSHVTITLINNTFSDNKSQYGGCSLSISGFVLISNDSIMRNNSYIENDCAEGGAAAYITFMSGVLTIEDCNFENNSGQAGTAIFSSHKGAVDDSSYLEVRRCSFRGNVGRSVIQIAGVETPLILSSENTFTSNEGSSFYINAGKWIDRNSVYMSNSASEGGVFVSLDYSYIRMQNSTCYSNSASIKGGVGSISIQSTFICEACTFSSNSCSGIGGVISIDQQSSFSCTHCLMNNNTAFLKGSAIYSIFSYISIANSVISDNVARDFGTIVLLESSCGIIATEMTRNTANNRSPGLILAMSNLTITNCTSWNQTGTTGAFLFGSILNRILIANSRFSQGNATSGGVFYLTTNSSMTVVNTEFRDCTASTDSSIGQIRSVTAVFRNVTMSGLIAPPGNGAFYMIQSDLTIDSSVVSNMQGSVAAGQSSIVCFTNTVLELITATYGPAVNCLDCYLLTVSKCTIRNNVAKQGGAVYSYATGFLADVPKSIFTENTFSGNKAVNGGAIFSNSVQMELVRNSFIDNSARGDTYNDSGLLNFGIGGGVFAVCEFIPYCNFHIEGNRFERNTAETRGGAIHWFDSYPQIFSNTMINNTAKYGADIASFPIKLVPMTSINIQVDYLSNDTIPLAKSIAHVASGQISGEVITLALVDHYGNVVSDDSSSSALISSDQSLTVSGSTQVVASEGIFTFSALIFKGKPETEQKFQVTTSGVEVALKTYTRDPTLYIPTVAVSLNFRLCLAGESLQGVECYPCPMGTFSLDPSEPCNSCPSHVTCYGNYTMAPDPGYWRPDSTLNLFFECPNPDACLGSPKTLTSVSLTGVCADGYNDNLCYSCVIGYSRQGKYNCGKCPSLTSNTIVLTLIAIAALTLGGVVVVVAIRGASRPRSELAIHLKIFMNYLQMIVVAASLNLNWPAFVTIFLNGQDTAGSMTEQLFSFDCILQKVSDKQELYTKLLANALLPAALQIFALSVWIFLSLCLTISQIRHKIIATLVMIIFVLHPSLTKMMFSMFACMEIMPEELWLVSDLSLRCWSSNHVRNILLVSVPSIAVWIFGLPMICFVILYRFRKRLSDPLTQLKFSFLYKGYHCRWYFWEFVILYRKVALVCASVFLSTVSIMVQALSVLAVLLVSLFFQLQIQPFVTPIFNRLELKSILVSSVTIYSGLFYETDSICNPHSAMEIKILFFIIILGVNSYFLLSWLRCVLPLMLEAIRRKLSCGKKNYHESDFDHKRVGSAAYLSPVNISAGCKTSSEVVPEHLDSSLGRVSPLNICDVPHNSPDVLEVEYSVSHDDISQCPLPT